MSHETQYPYEGGGLKLDGILTPAETHWTDGITIGGSGKPINYSVGPGVVSIWDASANPRNLMKAQADFEGTVSFRLYTRRDGIVHPDFFARAFVGVAIEHFERSLARWKQNLVYVKVNTILLRVRAIGDMAAQISKDFLKYMMQLKTK